MVDQSKNSFLLLPKKWHDIFSIFSENIRNTISFSAIGVVGFIINNNNLLISGNKNIAMHYFSIITITLSIFLVIINVITGFSKLNEIIPTKNNFYFLLIYIPIFGIYSMASIITLIYLIIKP